MRYELRRLTGAEMKQGLTEIPANGLYRELARMSLATDSLILTSP
jgi:hypothetical protein